jgi:hypothetical protein
MSKARLVLGLGEDIENIFVAYTPGLIQVKPLILAYFISNFVDFFRGSQE